VSSSFIKGLLSGSVLSGTSLLYATLGEVIVQRSGIVNLGLEGVLLIGAAVAFAATAETGSPVLGILAAALAGGALNLIFGFMVITRRANQLASGLTMMFFGIGLSALVGRPYVEKPIEGLPKLALPFLSDIPWLGTILFKYDILVYGSIPTALLVWWLLFYTRWGLSLRAVGESPVTAFAAGYRPGLLRYQALFLGGLLGGIGGAHLSIALTMAWAEHMTAGRGFIAVALVIFSKWHPLRAILGAFLFGGAIMLQLQLQARGIQISPFLLNMIPYLLTIVVLLVGGKSRRYAAPASLGRVYQGTE
jgi:ABC-type uncharacterized transport system permease subunit